MGAEVSSITMVERGGVRRPMIHVLQRFRLGRGREIVRQSCRLAIQVPNVLREHDRGQPALPNDQSQRRFPLHRARALKHAKSSSSSLPDLIPNRCVQNLQLQTFASPSDDSRIREVRSVENAPAVSDGNVEVLQVADALPLSAANGVWRNMVPTLGDTQFNSPNAELRGRSPQIV